MAVKLLVRVVVPRTDKFKPTVKFLFIATSLLNTTFELKVEVALKVEGAAAVKTKLELMLTMLEKLAVPWTNMFELRETTSLTFNKLDKFMLPVS